MYQAANPGCILEDFVRWYSPPDWIETVHDDSHDNQEESSFRGQLSGRMQRDGESSLFVQILIH